MTRPRARVVSPEAEAHLVWLIDEASKPSAYPHPVDQVEVHQTHISVVFLAGPYAYKIKKPVDLAFLDYHTLERRHHYCLEEVRLNRRLAPEVYLDVVAFTREADGRLAVEGTGAVVEWAVKMERLPPEATLAARVASGVTTEAEIVAVARRVAAFHRAGESGPEIAAGGRFAVVATNARENFSQAEAGGQIGLTVSRAVFDRLRDRTEACLAQTHALIELRAENQVPRDTHGDLRLDHVYVRPGLPPPHDLVIVDCIEFSDRFRHADPVCDAAFPVMDLIAAGRRDLAALFAEAYFEATADDAGRALLPFYTSYRAAVRGKVGGMTAAEPEVTPEGRAEALASARAHWLLSLEAIEPPAQRPALVLIGGLPGAGKSTLARAVAERAGFEVVRSDVVRKEMAAIAGVAPGPAAFGEGLYSAGWLDQTYDECLRRAEAGLFEGRRILVDASFAEDARRRTFLDAAAGWGVAACLLLCEAPDAVVRQRLDAREGTGDASDADVSIYERARALWEPPGPAVVAACRSIATDRPRDAVMASVLGHLRALGLY